MEAQDLEYRMYGLVPYALSGIQKGIQYGHAVVEYELMYGHMEDYQKWARVDKTFMLMNGRTFNSNIDPATGLPKGAMDNYLLTLKVNDVRCAEFREPDLQDGLTGIVFLVDERVFDHEYYVLPNYPQSPGIYTMNPPIPMPIPQAEIDAYNAECLRILGTPQNVFLRQFLPKLRLA